MSNGPVIIIPGIGQSRIREVDEKDRAIRTDWPFSIDEKAVLNDLKGSLMKMMIFKKDSGFSDKIAELIGSITSPLSVCPDGSKKFNVKAALYKKSIAEYSEDEKRFVYKMIPLQELGKETGEENMFFFAYDPFADLPETAAKLNEYIAFVKEKTGAEKTDLVVASVGGAVLRAYFMNYADNNDIGKVVNVVSALDGTEIVADLFEDKLNLSDPAGLLRSIGGKAESLASIVPMLPQEVIDNVISKSLSTLRNDLLYNCSTMWASVPNSRFDSVYAVRSAAGIDPVLDEKIKAFHDYTVNFVEKAKELSANGVKFFQICGYGKKLPAVFASENTSSDGIVDIHSSSLGITQCGCDATPDVSSAAFPETTWLYKDQGHSSIAYNDNAMQLIVNIITEKIGTIGSDSAYPQFGTAADNRK